MYPHCTVRIRLLYAFNKYFDFDFETLTGRDYVTLGVFAVAIPSVCLSSVCNVRAPY